MYNCRVKVHVERLIPISPMSLALFVRVIQSRQILCSILCNFHAIKYSFVSPRFFLWMSSKHAGIHSHIRRPIWLEKFARKMAFSTNISTFCFFLLCFFIPQLYQFVSYSPSVLEKSSQHFSSSTPTGTMYCDTQAIFGLEKVMLWVLCSELNVDFLF